MEGIVALIICLGDGQVLGPSMTLSSSIKQPRFPGKISLCAARWYLRYPLSYQNVVDLLAERGIPVDRSTEYRWIQTF